MVITENFAVLNDPSIHKSSVHPFILHISPSSIHPLLLSSAPPLLPKLISPGPLSLHSSKSQSLHHCIDPHTSIHLSSMNTSFHPFSLPSLSSPTLPFFFFFPWLLTPVEGLLQQDLTRSTTSAVPARTHTHVYTHSHTHTKALPTGCRRKDTQTSFSQLPEQLKWPGRDCAEERKRE